MTSLRLAAIPQTQTSLQHTAIHCNTQLCAWCSVFIYTERCGTLSLYYCYHISKKYHSVDTLFLHEQQKLQQILQMQRSGMGWLRLVGSIKLLVFFAEERLFYGALRHKRPIILSILLIVATQYHFSASAESVVVFVFHAETKYQQSDIFRNMVAVLWGSFVKETYSFIDHTNISQPTLHIAATHRNTRA